MRWSILCVDCNSTMPIVQIIPMKLHGKVNVLRKYPMLAGLFSGDVLFWPADDHPCLQAGHTLTAHASEIPRPKISPLKVKIRCRECNRHAIVRERHYDMVGDLCEPCLIEMEEEIESQGDSKAKAKTSHLDKHEGAVVG